MPCIISNIAALQHKSRTMNPLQTPTHIHECAVLLGHSTVTNLFMQPNLKSYNKMPNSNLNLIYINDVGK